MATEDLGPQERAVLEAIATNPFIGQQEIATALGLARSTIAAHVVQLIHKGYILGRGYVLPAARRVVCFGGATVDRKYHASQPPILGTSNPVEGRRAFGGVARNVAENLARLGVEVGLISILGNDEAGHAVLRHLRDIGIDVSRMATSEARPTAEYAAVLGPDSALVLGIADMGIFDLLTPAHLERAWPHLASASWIFAECNLSAAILAGLLSRRQGARCRLAVDAVSTPKVTRLPRDLDGLDILFINHDEAAAWLGRADLSPADAARALLDRGAAQVVLTLGAAGAVVAEAGGLTALPPVPAHPVDVTGAGDALIAGTLFRLLAGDSLPAAARTGTLLAALTTEHGASVHPDLSPRFLAAATHRIAAPAGA